MKIKPVIQIQILKHMQHFVIIVFPPNLQHAKHTVKFGFSLKMASAHGREVSCVCSFTKLTQSCSSVCRHIFFPDSWWLMALECLWSVSLTMFIPKINSILSEYGVSWVPLLLFLSFSPLFTCSLHSLERELILLVCSVNEWSAEKTLSMMEKGCTHTPTKSLYHSLQDWITKMNNWL